LVTLIGSLFETNNKLPGFFSLVFCILAFKRVNFYARTSFFAAVKFLMIVTGSPAVFQSFRPAVESPSVPDTCGPAAGHDAERK
jgi:hypothetical protein